MTITFRQQFWKLEVNLGFIWSHKYNILIINHLLNNLWSLCLTEARAHALVPQWVLPHWGLVWHNLKSSLHLLSFKDTAHIHLTIIRSVSSFQTSQVISLHCPGFSSMYWNTLDTSTIDPSFDMIRCTKQNRRMLLELGPSTSPSSSKCKCTTHLLSAP